MEEEDKTLLKGHRERAKEKFLNSFNNNIETSDYETLELILFYSIPRKDTKILAKHLINAFGSLQDVINAPESKLKEFKNISQSTIILFRLIQSSACVIIGKQNIIKKPIFSVWTQMVEHCYKKFSYLEKEILAVFYLNKSNILVKEEILQEGTIDKLAIYPREVITKAIANKSCNIIIVHNHPSGSKLPSRADISVTKNLKQALAFVDIKLVDHIIIARDGFTSLREMNLM